MSPILPNDLPDLEPFKKHTPQEEYQFMTEREKQVQASLWAINFLIAELAAGLLVLRQKLVQKNFLTLEEDDELADTILNPANLQVMYNNVELAFAEKYQKVRFAIEHPEQVAREVNEMPGGSHA